MDRPTQPGGGETATALAGCALTEATRHGAEAAQLLLAAYAGPSMPGGHWRDVVVDCAVDEARLANHWYCYAERLGYVSAG